MDSISQAALGAGIFGTVLGRYHGRKAVVAGAILGTLPDLDIVIRYADPVLAMIHHRGFSHSLFVLTALTIALTTLLRSWRPSAEYGTSRLFWAIWLTLITHPLLDAFTSYGTQLLWPLRPTPTAWSSIFIIDPFFTVPLTVAVVAALIAGPGPRIRRALIGSMAWCCIYLAASIAFKQIVEHRVTSRLQHEGLVVNGVFSTPQPLNILLWRVVVKTSDGQYHEANVSLLDRAPPETLSQPLNAHLLDDFPASEALDGLQWFSGNWLRYDDIDGNLVASDLRMGLGTGYYFFRFLLAERLSAADRWQLITPRHWSSARGTEQLPIVLRRIWQQFPPIPQAIWAENMTEPAN